MHELDNPQTLQAVLTSLKAQLKVTDIRKIASGNEFVIFRTDLDDSPVVIKVPKDKVFSNVNDAHIDSRVLLDQEYKLSQHAAAHGMAQVAQPRQQLMAAGFGALVIDYVPSDDSHPNQFELGQLLANIHSLPLPDFILSAQEQLDAPELIACRLTRRWQQLSSLVDGLPNIPPAEHIVHTLHETRSLKHLLHMDVRRANLRTQDGHVLAVIDWSNALIGHPALELARVAETGETSQDFLKGYASVTPLPIVSPLVETIFRLDTATMLALVFLSEDPDPELAPKYVAQVRELHKSVN